MGEERYNGWANWATWCCSMHFSEELGEILRETAERNFGKSEDDIRMIFTDAARDAVEEVVNDAVSNKPVDEFPPVAELFNHTSDIDYYDIFETYKRDCKYTLVEMDELDDFLVPDGMHVGKEILSALEDEYYLDGDEDDGTGPMTIDNMPASEFLKEFNPDREFDFKLECDGRTMLEISGGPLFEEEKPAQKPAQGPRA